ncbi:unnamed protein product [Auanema sp. JU1783]|nr:unnamed protein product [Auanema sp. JU1783]
MTERIINGLHPNNLRYLFYLVTPNETIYSTMEEVPNYTDLSVIWLLVLVITEFYFLDDRKYAFNDTVTSINAGIFSLLIKFGGRYLSAKLYKDVYDYIHIIDLPPDSPTTWIICFFSQDLMYYLGHRAIHEAGVFWSFHQMHHSSEYYNLSTALRQGAVQDFGMAFFDLLQCIAIPPNIFVVHRYLNVLYQFWLHTEMIPYLGFLEYFFNTPSSHRVHHGRNAYCIDRNYGGTLIIWDRLFGTYAREKENEEIAYGLVSPVNTFDQFYCQFFEFKELGYDKARLKDDKGNEIFPTWLEKFKATFGPPGYFPGVKTKQFFWWRCMVDNEEGIPEIEKPIRVYNPTLNYPIRLYLLATMLVLVSSALHFNEIRQTLSNYQCMLYFIYLLAIMQTFGYYFDQSKWAFHFDLFRLAVLLVGGLNYDNMSLINYSLISLFTIITLNSLGLIDPAKETKKIQ